MRNRKENFYFDIKGKGVERNLRVTFLKSIIFSEREEL